MQTKNRMGSTYLVRREHFSASHRLHCYGLSEHENVEVFGLCNNPNGHGHNYVLEVTIKGEICPKTGMVMNLTTLKKVIKDSVLDKLDHKNLDLDVDYFRETNRVSTTENVAKFIWDQIEMRMLTLPDETYSLSKTKAVLHEIKLWETEKNMVIYRG